MQRTVISAIIFITALISSPGFAEGLFFNVASSGNPANVNITLCLDAKGPFSCQRYNVSALDLTILTTIADHPYSSAGIKINSPYYSIANAGVSCTPLSNGYCMFSVSNTTPAN